MHLIRGPRQVLIRKALLKKYLYFACRPIHVFLILLFAPILLFTVESPEQQAQVNKSDYAKLTGSVFYPEPSDPFRAPHVRELMLDPIPDGESIWGSTGRDSRGHIWIGVSTRRPGTSAHLLEYDPKIHSVTDHGSVIDQLRRLDLYEEGIGQIKIHSKIIQGADGWLYFASTDEEGEDFVSSTLPPNGAHLWRIYPGRKNWEHLFATPEAIIAVSGVGRFIYALGYWDHVLYQYDTQTKQHRRIVVGSADGHISRNFLADIRGHAFVPRVTKHTDGTYTAALIEYDEQLNEIGSTALQYYLGKQSPEDNHGIVGIAYLSDHRMMFTSHRGQVYEISPVETGSAHVTAMGWMHPEGEAYAPGLYAFGGDTWLAGITERGGTFEWVVRNFAAVPPFSKAFRIELGSLSGVLLYGSITTDDLGRIYAVGWAADEQGGHRPLVLPIAPAR